LTEPIIISNWRHGRSAIPTGIEKLKQTGFALDAVEYAIRAVEDDPLADSVGTGGIPNIEGIGELDASIMVGNTYRCGAVSCLTLTQNPISVARKVMEICPHVMLCGDGATRFARAAGFPEYQPVTEKAREKWKDLHEKLLAAMKDQSKIEEYHKTLGYDTNLVPLGKGVEMMMEAGQIKELGTVGTLCLDSSGTIVAGTSTSGAGTYATPAGASSSTGLGEIAIRHGLTRTVCDFLAEGYDPTEACETALRNMLRRDQEITVIMALIALDKNGRVGGATTKESYSYQYQRLSDSKMTEVVPTPVSI
jgi:N4-(beta-N-acetylglucosaminyl)-L-asparaginase